KDGAGPYHIAICSVVYGAGVDIIVVYYVIPLMPKRVEGSGIQRCYKRALCRVQPRLSKGSQRNNVVLAVARNGLAAVVNTPGGRSVCNDQLPGDAPVKWDAI